MTKGASTLMDMRLLAAQAVAREAGALARRRFVDQSFTVGFKGPHDFLTEVDGETEALIAERLLEVFPGDGFIGEESKARPAGEGGAVWVVDPIDGTANFARGVPHFCVSIACVAGDKVEVGVIYDPMRDELFAGRRGGGARLNGRPCARRARTRLPVPRSRSAGTSARVPSSSSISCGGSRPPAPPRHGLAQARSRSLMSRPAGAKALSSIISMHGIVLRELCWSPRRAAM